MEEEAVQHSPGELKALWNAYMIDGARFGDLDDVKEALAHDADVNAVDVEGRTALHMAAANAYESIARVLLEAGANTEAANESGNTALHWGCVGGSASMVRLLLKYGSNPSALNQSERTPLDDAIENAEILQIFQEISAAAESMGASDDGDAQEGDPALQGTDACPADDAMAMSAGVKTSNRDSTVAALARQVEETAL